MEKDKTIIGFLKRIQSFINLYSLEIVDYWNADICAVGLKKGNKLIYIATFNFNVQIPIKYDYDLEMADDLATDNYKVVKKGRAVTERELLTEIESFLSI